MSQINDENIKVNTNEVTFDASTPFRTAHEAMMAKVDSPEWIEGIATGFADIDQWLSGLFGGDLICVTGEPKVGKTVFASNIACNIVGILNKPVLYFTLDMQSYRLAKRMIISSGKMNCSDIYAGRFSDDDWGRIGVSFRQLCLNKIFFIEDSKKSLVEMMSYSRLLNESNKLGLVVIDYLQLTQEMIQEIPTIAKISIHMAQLKAMAAELNVPVMVLSSRIHQDGSSDSHLHERMSAIPHVDIHLDIKNSDDRYNNHKNSSVVMINVVSARNIREGYIPLLFLKEFLRFDNLLDNECQ